MTPTTSRTPGPPEAPGWYTDPHGSGMRYWNGRAWTNLRRAPRQSSAKCRSGGWVTLSGSSRTITGY